MDLDSFHREFLAFKRRVMPMLEAWEAHGGAVSPEDKEAADALNAEIYKPLEPAKPDEPKAADAATGPTIAQWVGAGKKASDYPPAGYQSNSPQSEIDAAVMAEKAAR